MGEAVKDEYQTDYVAGQDNINPLGLDLHAPVFLISSFLVVAFVVGTLMFPAEAMKLLDGVKWSVIGTVDWFFLLSANICVGVARARIFMPVGHHFRPGDVTRLWGSTGRLRVELSVRYFLGRQRSDGYYHGGHLCGTDIRGSWPGWRCQGSQ